MRYRYFGSDNTFQWTVSLVHVNVPFSGGQYGPNVRKWMNTDREADLGQAFMALDPSFFAPGFEDRMGDLMNHCRNMEPVSWVTPASMAATLRTCLLCLWFCDYFLTVGSLKWLSGCVSGWPQQASHRCWRPRAPTHQQGGTGGWHYLPHQPNQWLGKYLTMCYWFWIILSEAQVIYCHFSCVAVEAGHGPGCQADGVRCCNMESDHIHLLCSDMFMGSHVRFLYIWKSCSSAHFSTAHGLITTYSVHAWFTLCFVMLLLECFCSAMDVLFDKYFISLLSISILDLMQWYSVSKLCIWQNNTNVLGRASSIGIYEWFLYAIHNRLRINIAKCNSNN